MSSDLIVIRTVEINKVTLNTSYEDFPIKIK